MTAFPFHSLFICSPTFACVLCSQALIGYHARIHWDKYSSKYSTLQAARHTEKEICFPCRGHLVRMLSTSLIPRTGSSHRIIPTLPDFLVENSLTTEQNQNGDGDGNVQDDVGLFLIGIESGAGLPHQPLAHVIREDRGIPESRHRRRSRQR